MAHQDIFVASTPGSDLPAVRTVTFDDIKDALARGVDDFMAMPTHAIFLSLIYPIVGLVIGRAIFGYDIVPLLFPLAAGFALVGPLAAIGLYELSRRREAGLDISWMHAFDVLRSPSIGAIAALGILLLVIFGTWIAVAHAIYIANFGYREPNSLTGFLRQVLTTPQGWTLIVVGNAVGLIFATVTLAISVVSFPLLLDRKVGAATAILTSLRTVARNPGPMVVWGLTVAAALLIGSIPLFFGLAIAMPVLGHATWHLYRKAVEPGPQAPHQDRITPKGPRYAADFPASLFPWAREDRL